MGITSGQDQNGRLALTPWTWTTNFISVIGIGWFRMKVVSLDWHIVVDSQLK